MTIKGCMDIFKCKSKTDRNRGGDIEKMAESVLMQSRLKRMGYNGF